MLGQGAKYLVEVGADTTLPVLAEIYNPSVRSVGSGSCSAAYGCAGSAGCA